MIIKSSIFDLAEVSASSRLQVTDISNDYCPVMDPNMESSQWDRYWWMAEKDIQIPNQLTKQLSILF